jgi:hypothetical protein
VDGLSLLHCSKKIHKDTILFMFIQNHLKTPHSKFSYTLNTSQTKITQIDGKDYLSHDPTTHIAFFIYFQALLKTIKTTKPRY